MITDIFSKEHLCHALSIENESLKKTSVQMEMIKKENGRLKLKLLELERKLVGTDVDVA